VRTHRNTLGVDFCFFHPVTSGTKMINSTLNTPYNNFMRGSFRAFIFLNNAKYHAIGVLKSCLKLELVFLL
jgi:hypothetical protein